MREEISQAMTITVTDEATEVGEMVEAEKKQWEAHCIYKLPSCVIHLNREAYKPRAVSFGPYHHGDPDLNHMEPHKERVLHRFLGRSRRSMEECAAMLRAFAKDWMDAYYFLDPKWEQDMGAFMEMMIRDGCFMLEVLRYSENDREGTSTYYAKNDPIFSSHGKLHMMSYIMRDMLMLENQLPMSVLVELLSIEDQESKEKEQDEYLIRLIFQGGPRNRPSYKSLSQKHKDELKLKECKHVLDVHRKLLIFGDGDGSSNSTEQSHKPPSGSLLLDILPSATRLRDSGIAIRKSGTTSITDITFKRGILGGVLKIPQIVVDDTTESIFLNLMAFERFHVGIGSEVTSYISFMDDIIDNQSDVSLLHTHQIVENAFGSDRAVADLFNSLTKDTALDPASPLSGVRYEAKIQCSRRWNRWWGDFIHTYFINPWTVIAFVAAILFFGLDTTDTIFSIRDDLSDMHGQ